MSTPEEVKAQYPKTISLEIDGKVLVFKPLTKAMITDLKKQITEKPGLALDFSINACKFCCVYGAEHFADLSNLYALAFAGSAEHPGVIDALFDLARGGGNAVIRTE